MFLAIYKAYRVNNSYKKDKKLYKNCFSKTYENNIAYKSIIDELGLFCKEDLGIILITRDLLEGITDRMSNKILDNETTEHFIKVIGELRNLVTILETSRIEKIYLEIKEL